MDFFALISVSPGFFSILFLIMSQGTDGSRQGLVFVRCFALFSLILAASVLFLPGPHDECATFDIDCFTLFFCCTHVFVFEQASDPWIVQDF
ncbi:hypothetical protein BJY00DRAFT_253426 [Aspergillus carlsbadensis]|nr:hypothetical protein BJY00DRAFT_253426 [Aspergillus carlsbadensis]